MALRSDRNDKLRSLSLAISLCRTSRAYRSNKESMRT
jgi:hypothetical protein